jgi:nucleoside-diphosphate kinase
VEQTLIIIKPDAVQRGLIGSITGRFERRGLKIVAMKMIQISEDLARRHYAEHEGKPFYDGLIEFITAAPSVCMVIEGPDAIEIVRATIGVTNPAEAMPGTIRADFGIRANRNLVHASDSEETARREIASFFQDDELLGYDQTITPWLYRL